MWGLSLVSWANFIALLFGVIAVLALYVSATDADKRIAEARARGDEARAEAAKANERANTAAEHAASLEKEAAEARLKLAPLEKQSGPRQIDREVFLDELKGKKKNLTIFLFHIQRPPEMDGMLPPNCGLLLQEAGWPSSWGQAVDLDSPLLGTPPILGPGSLSAGSLSSGITIVFAPNAVNAEDTSTPFATLVQAIFKTLGTSAGVGSDRTLLPGQLRLVIFPRP